jgi:hypothetical protein
MPQGMKPRNRRVKMATKPIRKAFKKITEGMMISPKTLQTGPRRIKTDGRITKEDMEKYMKMKPREYQTGIPRQTKGPMQARPLPMTPELIKKAKDRMVPNPRAQQRDRSKPIIGKPMRRSSARKNNG